MVQKIVPCLWYDHQGEEAARFYTSVFQHGKMGAITHYAEGGMMPEGQVMTVQFELAGQAFIALNGGPYFQFTPAISMFVGCESVKEMETLWDKLIDGGMALMEPDALPPFFEKFGWLQDKYGLSWQLGVCGIPQYINPFFLFVGEQAGKAEEAIRFYASIFQSSEVKVLNYFGKNEYGEKEGSVQHAQFSLGGQPFMAMDSAMDHRFAFTEAVSFYVYCHSQAEIDYYWDKLSAPDSQGQCGWLKDPYGISWQIVPDALEQWTAEADYAASKRVMDALMNMTKLDIATLQKAYENKL